MSLPGFDLLYAEADALGSPVPIAAAGGDDATVLEALRAAADRGWVIPVVVGPAEAVRVVAGERAINLEGFTIVDVKRDHVAKRAVAEVRRGRAVALMKGRIDTPALLRVVLDRETGLRTEQVVCQVVLMEILRDARRFLLADTGITVRPTPEQKADILRSASALARALGVERPRVAMMAASESVNPMMHETLDAAYMQTRNEAGEIDGCVVQGPLSFDLAYAADAVDKKQVGGPVIGAADVMIFPDLLSANLTVKAIMYTADCRFGGVLRGTSAPVAFMSRADTTTTRLNSLALTLKVIAKMSAEVKVRTNPR
jgi:phosphotransacetylase